MTYLSSSSVSWIPGLPPSAPKLVTGSLQVLIDVSEVDLPWNWQSWELQYIINRGNYPPETDWKPLKVIFNPNLTYTHNFGAADVAGQSTVWYRYRIHTGSTTGAWSDIATSSLGFQSPVQMYKFVTDIGDNVTSTFKVPHNLGTEDIDVSIYEKGIYGPFVWEKVYTTVQPIGLNSVQIIFKNAPKENQYRVVVIG